MNETGSVLIQTLTVTLAAAREIAEEAHAAARRHQCPGAIAVVDNGGNLILAERWDGTMTAAIQIAVEKATTALAFLRSTDQLESSIASGRTVMLSPSRGMVYSPLKGGAPIRCGSEVVGAFAIAGTMDAELDHAILLETLAAIEAWPAFTNP